MNITEYGAPESRFVPHPHGHEPTPPIEITWATGPTGMVSEDSRSWREFTGQNFEAMKGFGWLDAVHPEDRQRVRETWVECTANGSIYVSEFRLRRADDEMRSFSVRGVPIIENGEVGKVAGFGGDITDAINYLHMILRERDFSNAVIECLPGIFYVTDEDGNMLRWNRAAELISGYSSEELAHAH